MPVSRLSLAQRLCALFATLLIGDTLVLLALWKINLGTLMPGAIGTTLALIVWRRADLARVRQQYPAVAALWRAGQLAAGLALAGWLGFVGWASQEVARPETATPASIVVLGAGLRGTLPSPTLQNRLDAAINLARRYPDAQLVVSGGQGMTEQTTEALAMQTYLERAGVAPTRIHQEDQSTSTEENLRFSRQQLLGLGLDPASHPAVIVTSDFHRLRSARLAQRAGYRNASVSTAATPWSIRPNAWLREYMVCAKSWLRDEI